MSDEIRFVAAEALDEIRRRWNECKEERDQAMRERDDAEWLNGRTAHWRGRAEEAEQRADRLAAALTFSALSEANASRARRWHPGYPGDDDWNGADWSNAMCGEAGEAANVVKKLRRHETGHHGALDGDEGDLRAGLAHELADVILYADLLATKYGIDLEAAVVEKFNIVSERQAFPERLGALAASQETPE